MDAEIVSVPAGPPPGPGAAPPPTPPLALRMRRPCAVTAAGEAQPLGSRAARPPPRGRGFPGGRGARGPGEGVGTGDLRGDRVPWAQPRGWRAGRSLGGAGARDGPQRGRRCPR